MAKIGKLNVGEYTKSEVMTLLDGWLSRHQSALVVTPYSEFVVEAEKNPELVSAVNTADVSIADGIGIVWAGHYLGSSESIWRVALRVLVGDSGLYSVFPEKISGSDFMYDVLALAHVSGRSVYLVGGSPEVSRQMEKKISEKYPDIRIAGRFDGKVQRGDESLFQNIHQAQADVILIALSPPFQEIWGSELRNYLRSQGSPGVIFCFGGSFDFFVGAKIRAPWFLRKIGLEWLWRLILEPKRLGRMYRATWVFGRLIMRIRG